MFLNDFDKRDENAGVNVKLSEVYLEEHLPHYIWGDNENVLYDLKDLLSEYIYLEKRKMLLILGQPGIGKSTLITWITANFTNCIEKILIYKFAPDLQKINWKVGHVFGEILWTLGLTFNALNRKILILDGFDEVSIENNRIDILNKLYEELMHQDGIKDFSLILTCRENYVQELNKLRCKYITLELWNDAQITSFYRIFKEKTKASISEYMQKKIIENAGVFGIPLILYMVLALNISITGKSFIVDIYDQIFSLSVGGIYNRCIKNSKYEAMEHWINEIKEQIHQISGKIAIWMFEYNPDKAYIPYEEYRKICYNVTKEQAYEGKYKYIEQDVLIGNFFRKVKYCEGLDSGELHFIHRSIYEYFVADVIYKSIENSIKVLSEASQEEFASNIAFYLKEGQITPTIGEYLQYKITNLCNKISREKKNKFYQWLEDAVSKMLDSGMFYFEKNNSVYPNIIHKECQCFLNLIEILRLLLFLGHKKYIMSNINRKQLEKYIRYCCIEYKLSTFNGKLLDFSKMYLAGVNLRKADLSYMSMKFVDFTRADLSYATFYKADLQDVILEEADLNGADLRAANLENADLKSAVLVVADLRMAKLISAKLIKSNLREANLSEANMSRAFLVQTDLSRADLRGTNIYDAKFENTILEDSIVYEKQIGCLEGHFNLHEIRIYIEKMDEVLSYEEYYNEKV